MVYNNRYYFKKLDNDNHNFTDLIYLQFSLNA